MLACGSVSSTDDSVLIQTPRRSHRGDLTQGPDGSLGKGDGSLEWVEHPAGSSLPGATDRDIVWTRLQLPESNRADLALRINAPKLAYEIYFQGRKIGGAGTLHPGGRPTPPGLSPFFHPLPPEAEGQELWFRLQSAAGQAPRVDGVRLGSLGRMQMRWLLDRLPPLVFSVIPLGIGVVAALVWLRRREAMMGRLAIFGVVSGVTLACMTQTLSLLGFDPLAVLWMLCVAAACTGPATLALATIVCDVETVLIRRVYNAGWIAAGVLTLWITVAPEWNEPVMACGAGLLILALIVSFITALAPAREGRIEARILIAAVLGLAAFTIHDVLVVAGVSAGDPLVPWAFLGLVVSLGLGALRRLETVGVQLRETAQHLQERQAFVELASTRMRAGAGELAATVEQLRQTSKRQGESLSRQATTLQQTQVTAEEIRQTSHLAAEQAAALLARSSQADEIGKRGEEALTQSIQLVVKIGEEVTSISDQLRALNLRTREIGSIVDTVKGLADQSNMLALNAAIEAVRSGEQGKGFGVVAREVRSLADQSIHATSQHPGDPGRHRRFHPRRGQPRRERRFASQDRTGRRPGLGAGAGAADHHRAGDQWQRAPDLRRGGPAERRHPPAVHRGQRPQRADERHPRPAQRDRSRHSTPWAGSATPCGPSRPPSQHRFPPLRASTCRPPIPFVSLHPAAGAC